jgi:hypothetical protein
MDSRLLGLGVVAAAVGLSALRSKGSALRTLMIPSRDQLEVIKWGKPRIKFTKREAKARASASFREHSGKLVLSRSLLRYIIRGLGEWVFDDPIMLRILPLELQDPRELFWIDKDSKTIKPLWRVEILESVPEEDKFGRPHCFEESGQRIYIDGKPFRIQP